uniref:Uncharacterized protein n=1 Tax=Onchocerca volvulus TaxID=6282 RepID=A0A8R1XLJ6_ONCVO
MPNHRVYTPSAGSMDAPSPSLPPPAYYQALSPGYQPSPLIRHKMSAKYTSAFDERDTAMISKNCGLMDRSRA